MRGSIYLWFWICFLANLMGSYRTEVGEFPENSGESSEISADPMKRLDAQPGQVKQKLIREIHSDMKTFLHDFPNVVRDVNETGRSVLQMRTFILPFLTDIEIVQKDVAVIKRYVQNIYKNLSSVCSDSKPDRTTFHAIKNLTRLSNSSFTRFKNIYAGLRDNYRNMNENYKAVSSNISLMQQSLNFINTLWPLVESAVNASLAKLDLVVTTEEEIKQQLINSKYEIRHELARLEQKLELTLAVIREDTRLVNERITQESEEITAKILELKDIILYHCHLTPGMGRNLRGPKFSIKNILDYIPLIVRFSKLLEKLKQLKPIVGIGGTVGVGHLFENFNGSSNPTGLAGAIGGVIIFPNISLHLLGEISSLLPTPAGTPEPTPPPRPHPWPFPFPDIPDIGDLIPGLFPPGSDEEPDEKPTRPPAKPTRPPAKPTRPPAKPTRPPAKPTRPPGEPTRPPGEPTRPPGEPTRPPGEPARPSGEPTRPPGEPTRPPGEPTRPPGEPTRPPGEPTRPPGEPTRPPGEPTRPPARPEEPARPPAIPTKPPAKPTLPTESPGLPGRPADRPDKPSYPDDLPPMGDIYPPTIPPMPTPIPKPAEMHDPIPLRPIVPLDIDGLDDHCACRCSCPCDCPVLPVPVTKSPWWMHLPIFQEDGMPCECLCACPCPAERKRQIVRREVPDFYQDVAILDKEIRFLQKDLENLKTSVTDRLFHTETAIIGEMNSRFLEVTSVLAAIQRSNEYLHEKVRFASGGVQQLMEREIVKMILPQVRTVSTALEDLRDADETLRDDIRHTSESFKAIIKRIYGPGESRGTRSEEGNLRMSRNEMEALGNVSITEPPFSTSEIPSE